MLAFVEIVKREALKVADQDVAWPVPFGQGIEILPGLPVGAGQIAARALLLHDQDARPEQVDEPGLVIQLAHMLLVARDGPPPHSENLEERVVEALRFTLLVGRVLPLAGKVGSPGAHFVPRQAHGLQGFLIETVFVDRNKAVCEASRHLPGPDWWAQLPVPRIW